jgi:hypothetical protein
MSRPHDRALVRSLQLKVTPFLFVADCDFEYPHGSEIWTTLNALADIEANEAYRTGLLRDVEILGRLPRGVTVEQAADEVAVMTAGSMRGCPRRHLSVSARSFVTSRTWSSEHGHCALRALCGGRPHLGDRRRQM